EPRFFARAHRAGRSRRRGSALGRARRRELFSPARARPAARRRERRALLASARRAVTMTAMRALVAMVLALAGCGDGESSGADLSAGSCSGSLSGAVSEKIVSCKVTWDEQSGAADVGNDG